MSYPNGMIKSAASRGDTPVKLKVESWPQAAVVITGLITAAAVLVLLVRAGWSVDGIVAAAVAVAGIFTGQFVTTRKASVVEAKTDAQTETLDVIARQTNGVSTDERQDIAERAATTALRRHAADRKMTL